jgi:hypothetical protein
MYQRLEGEQKAGLIGLADARRAVLTLNITYEGG